MDTLRSTPWTEQFLNGRIFQGEGSLWGRWQWETAVTMPATLAQLCSSLRNRPVVEGIL